MCSKTENWQVKFCLKKIKVISTTAVYLPKLSLGKTEHFKRNVFFGECVYCIPVRLTYQTLW